MEQQLHGVEILHSRRQVKRGAAVCFNRIRVGCFGQQQLRKLHMTSIARHMQPAQQSFHVGGGRRLKGRGATLFADFRRECRRECAPAALSG